MPNCPECHHAYTPTAEKQRCTCGALLPAAKPAAPKPSAKYREGFRQVHLQMPDAMHEELTAAAAEETLSLSAMIRQCIKAELARRRRKQQAARD